MYGFIPNEYKSTQKCVYETVDAWCTTYPEILKLQSFFVLKVKIRWKKL